MLKFYASVEKWLKLKFSYFLKWLIPTFLEGTREKLVGDFLPSTF